MRQERICQMADSRLIHLYMDEPLNKRFSLRINAKELEAFKKLAARKHIPFGVAVRIAMWEWLKKSNPRSTLPHPQGHEAEYAEPATILPDDKRSGVDSALASAEDEAELDARTQGKSARTKEKRPSR